MKDKLTSQALANPFEILTLPLTAKKEEFSKPLFREEFSMPFQILGTLDIEPSRK